MLTIIKPGDDHNLPKGKYIYGANMAFSVERLLAIGAFPEQLGRNGHSLLSCEETGIQDACERRATSSDSSARQVFNIWSMRIDCGATGCVREWHGKACQGICRYLRSSRRTICWDTRNG